MTRRKGERPVPTRLDTYSASHPVAQMIAAGDHWFDAWLMQKGSALAHLSRQTGISGSRLLAISMNDRLSQVELDALARAWSISAADLLASVGGATEVVP